jgi:nucleotide-binding universal stress UspA family protein
VVDLGKLASQGSMTFGVAPRALQQALDDDARAAEEYVERTCQELAGRGLTATGEARHGVAAREIVASTLPGDLIVMATHGRGGMTRWFLGSVAEEVARRSPAPVMLVRPTPAAANGRRAEDPTIGKRATAQTR